MNSCKAFFVACILLLASAASADQVDDLLKDLSSGDSTKQFRALAFLKSIDDPRVTTAVIAQASGPGDVSVRANCITFLVAKKSMESLGTFLQLASDTKQPFAIRSQALRGLVALSGSQHAGLFIQLIKKDPDPLVRSMAAQALGNTGDPKILPQIRALLNDPDPSLVPYVILALANTGDPSVVPDLIARLKTSDPMLKSTIVAALGHIGDKRAVPVLVDLFKEDNDLQRISIIVSLANINDPAAVARIISVVPDKAFSQNVRTQALLALAALKSPAAIQPVAALAASPAENILLRQVAARTLGNFGDDAIPILLPLLDDKAVADDAGLALGKITGNYQGTSRARWTDFYNNQYKPSKQPNP